LYAVTFSGDGRLVVCGGEEGRVYLRAAATGAARADWPGPGGPVRALVRSSDGKTLMSGGHTLRVWGFPTGDVVRDVPHSTEVYVLAVSPNGRFLAGGDWEGRVTVWDIATGRTEAVHEGWGSPVRSVVFAPDGRTLAAVGGDSFLRVWDVPPGRGRFELQAEPRSLTGLAYSPDGRTLAAVAAEGMKLWEPGSWRVRRADDETVGPVQGLAFAPDSQTLAVAADDLRVTLWSHSWPGIKMAAVGPGSAARTVTLHDVATRSWITSLAGPHPVRANCVAFAPDGQTLAVGSIGGSVWRWDGAGRTARRSLYTSRTAENYWNEAYATAAAQRLFPVFPDRTHDLVWQVAYSPDGRWLAAAGGGEVLLGEAGSDSWHSLPLEHSQPQCLAFSPDGCTLATNHQTEVRLWDTKHAQLRRTLSGHRDTVRSVAISGDGLLLASGSEDGQILLWDLQTGQVRHTLLGHADAVTALVFTPNGATLASSSLDGLVKLWRVSEGRELAVLRGHSGPVRCLVFSPDGQRLASGGPGRGGRGEVLLWPR
jgi:WD40 repeat protein